MDVFRAAVRVKPGSHTDAVVGRAPTAGADERPVLAVRVRARPVDGAATAATERVLAGALGLRGRGVRTHRLILDRGTDDQF